MTKKIDKIFSPYFLRKAIAQTPVNQHLNQIFKLFKKKDFFDRVILPVNYYRRKTIPHRPQRLKKDMQKALYLTFIKGFSLDLFFIGLLIW